MGIEPLTTASENEPNRQSKKITTLIFNALNKIVVPGASSIVTILILACLSYFLHIPSKFGSIEFSVDEGTNFTKSKPLVSKIDSLGVAKTMKGKWIDKWYDDGEKEEIFNITKIDSSHFWGNIADETDNPRGKWNLEGNYDGSYLQIWYYPTTSEPTAATDKGCYFFVWSQEKQFFKGIWVGHDATSFSTPDQIDTTSEILIHVLD